MRFRILIAIMIGCCAFGTAAVPGFASGDDAADPDATTGSGTTTAPQSPTTAPNAAQGASGATVTASTLDTYLASKSSPMTGQGGAFVASGSAWKIDPRLLVAIAGAESSFGSITCAPFNAWGYGCPNRAYEFTSWADGIDTVAEGLRTNYLAEGRTSVALIGAKYAPIGASNDPTNLNSAWVINVSRFLEELGGNPANVDASGIAGTMPVGVEYEPAAPEFDFKVADEKSHVGTSAATASVGAPVAIKITVKNSGTTEWTPETVRLRRTDIEPRLLSAPFAALSSASVKPNATATFVVEVSATGLQSVTVNTAWQLEGPSGTFGEPVERAVNISVAQTAFDTYEFVRSDDSSAKFTVLKLRNSGASSWGRDSDTEISIWLVQDHRGSSHGNAPTSVDFTNDRKLSGQLQREVEPGEWGSFALSNRELQDPLFSFDLVPVQGSTVIAGPVIHTTNTG